MLTREQRSEVAGPRPIRRRRRGVSRIPWVCLVLCALAPFACKRAEDEAAETILRPRILLVGVDGLEWDVVLPLIERGRMPELADLIERGSYGLLRTQRDAKSPVIWSTVATGKRRRKHGIRDFDRPDPEAPSGRTLYSNSDRTTKAFWNILSDYGRRVHTIGWFVTFPVEPINGVMVAQTNTASRAEASAGQGIRKGSLIEGVPGQVYPPDRQGEMMEMLRASDAALPALLREVFGARERPPSPQAKRLLEASIWAFRADATYAGIGLKLAGEQPPFDLMAVYLGGTDVAGHRFWRYWAPQQFQHPPAPAEVESFGQMIPDYYAYADRVIGDLRKAAGEDVTVFVISDHGMKAVNTSERFDSDEEGAIVNSGGHGTGAPPGVLIAAGAGIRRMKGSGAPARLSREALAFVGRVHDVTPTLLALLAIPIGRDMDGRVLTDLLDPAFLAAHPVQTVGTHDTEAWLASRPKAVIAAPDEEERREQLRALGYLE